MSTLTSPIEGILGFQVYGAAFQGHLTNIILNMFRKDSYLFIIRAEGGPHPRQWACRSGCITHVCRAVSGNSSSRDFPDQRHLNVRECRHEKGGLCSISSKRIDMEKCHTWDMLHPCDKTVGSEWDMPTHENMCKETTCNSPTYPMFLFMRGSLE